MEQDDVDRLIVAINGLEGQLARIAEAVEAQPLAEKRTGSDDAEAPPSHRADAQSDLATLADYLDGAFRDAGFRVEQVEPSGVKDGYICFSVGHDSTDLWKRFVGDHEAVTYDGSENWIEADDVADYVTELREVSE